MTGQTSAAQNEKRGLLDKLTSVIGGLTALVAALIAFDAALSKFNKESSVIFDLIRRGVREARPYPAKELQSLNAGNYLPAQDGNGGRATYWFVAPMDSQLASDGWVFSQASLGPPVIPTNRRVPRPQWSQCKVIGSVVVTDNYLLWQGEIRARRSGDGTTCVIPVQSATIEDTRSWLRRR